MHATASFQTAYSKRHMKTLCKHFAHKVPVTSQEQSGQVKFPSGVCDLTADDMFLSLKASAKDRPQLDEVVDILTRHLERFAFRENPELTWRFSET